MAESVDKLLKQAMLKRGADKAEAAVVAIGRMLRRKGAKRDELFGVLKQISDQAPQGGARYRAFDEMSQSVTADDQEWLTFLRASMDRSEAVSLIAGALLRVFGKPAYQELVDIVCDKKRPASTRYYCLDVITDHSGRPFAHEIPVMHYDNITEDMYPIAKLQAWAASGFADPEPIIVPTKELKKLGIELPGPYSKFLAKHEADEEYETDDGQWCLLAANELLAEVDVDGKKVPAIRQLSAFASSLKDVLGSNATTDDKDKPYPLKRLAAGWAIGTESSGDVLYLDPSDKHSVWIFYHDGGDVERVAKSFGGWKRGAERC